MKKIRIGKQIRVRWPILTNGQMLPLEGRDLTLQVVTPPGNRVQTPFERHSDVVEFTLPGPDQKFLGKYSLTLWENFGKDDQTVVDCCDAFQLVSTTCKEGGEESNLTTETVDLEASQIEVFTQGGVAEVTRQYVDQGDHAVRDYVDQNIGNINSLLSII